MRLATVRTPQGCRLHAVTEQGYADVSTAGEGPPLTDVGALLRSDEMRMEAVRKAALDGDAGPGGVDLGPPVLSPRSIVCVGRNYPEHIAEGKVDPPPYPLLFAKFPNTLIGSGDAVRHHEITTELDYEGELALVIGRTASRVRADDAFAYVAGYTAINDISARDLQAADLQWIRGKSLDTFAPLGPAFVTADEIDDVDALRILTKVNDEVRQDESCAEMIFKIPRLLEFITAAITLEPGDIVATGTPSGTGLGFEPPRYLSPGDVVRVTIDPIGTLVSPIVRGA